MERPFVLINFAISADGKIGTSAMGPSRFTSRADLSRLLEIRLRADALLVGRGTLEADEMSMTIPDELHPPRQPLRCIISRQGHFDGSHKVFQSTGGDIHLVVTDAASDFDETQYGSLGATCHRLSLSEFLSHAKVELGVATLLCEGGGTLVKELFALDAVDEINLTVAGHSLIGGSLSPTITGLPSEFFAPSRQFEISHCESHESGELFVTWRRAGALTTPSLATAS